MTQRTVAELKIETPEAMHELGLQLASKLTPGDLVLLTGPLGAGKTTLTRGIGEGLKAIGNVSSPTFVIARTHKTEDPNLDLVHVDAYRLGSPAEFDDIEIDWQRSIVLVEWGRGFTDGLTDSWLDIEIERSHDAESDERKVTVKSFGERFEGWQL
ncbi:MAG: tRNA (adenosine(37)-N6)-threonylcarbamoyltransferase complex ATPase subunit type 1 TsaE [Micrococcales bacterium]